MSPFVLVGSTLVATVAWWCHALLSDEDRYIRAVAPLAASPRFARLAATSAAAAARHRGGWRRGVGPRSARTIAVLTRRSMDCRAFPRVWSSSHRWLHRYRCRCRDPRVSAAMVALAASGGAVRIAAAVRSVPRGA